MTRLKWAASNLPYRPPRIASAAYLNSGKNGSTWATISSLPAGFRGGEHGVGLSAVESAIAFSTRTCLPAFERRDADRDAGR